MTPERKAQLLATHNRQQRCEIEMLRAELARVRKELQFQKSCVTALELKFLRMTLPKNLDLSDTMPALCRRQAE